MKNLLVLNKYLLRYKWRMLLGILFVSASNYFGILIPQKIRDALNFVQDQLAQVKENGGADPSLADGISQALLVFGLTVIGFMLIKGALMYLMRQTIIVNSRLIEYDIRKDLYRHLSGLDTSFYKVNRTGDLMSRITEDVSKVRTYLGPGILYFINLVSLFVFVIYAMFSVNARLAFYTLLPLPILSISIYYVSRNINKKSSIIQRQLSKITSITQEVFSGIRVIKSYGMERQFNGYFDQESESFKNKSLELARIQALFFPLMILLINVSTLLVVLVGGQQVAGGEISTGNIAEFIIYVNMLTWPVTAIGWIASVVQEAEASQERLNEILVQKSSLSSGDYNEVIKGDIVFDNVKFTYPDTNIIALNGVSFKLKKGEKLAIIGKTASGKSTIAELLTKNYDVDEGAISIDGIDIDDHSIANLRNNIAYVPQDVFLFSDNIRNNITFGVKEEKSLDEVINVAKYASVHEDIMATPKGYETMVGERGVTLSGGQKQRVSIARALIKNPKIIILDDCLSAVDTETEQEIMSYLDKVLNDVTTINITHRVNNLTNFDKILVLEEGEVVEFGSPFELMELDGIYANLMEQASAGNQIEY